MGDAAFAVGDDVVAALALALCWSPVTLGLVRRDDGDVMSFRLGVDLKMSLQRDAKMFV